MIRHAPLLAALLLCACAGSKQNSSFAYLSQVPTCAVVIKAGAPPESSDPRQDAERFWYLANGAVTDFVGEELEAGHDVKRITLPYAVLDRAAQYGVSALAKFHCSRLVQVVHDVQTDGDGPYFMFGMKVLRAEHTEGDHARLVMEYERDYRFVRTGETIGQFVPSDFAHTALADAEQAGALKVFRK